MIYDTPEQIQEKLAEAKHIYYYSYYGDLVLLKYDDGKLIAPSPFGGESFKPVSDVERIDYNDDSESAQVFWKV